MYPTGGLSSVFLAAYPEGTLVFLSCYSLTSGTEVTFPLSTDAVLKLTLDNTVNCIQCLEVLLYPWEME